MVPSQLGIPSMFTNRPGSAQSHIRPSLIPCFLKESTAAQESYKVTGSSWMQKDEAIRTVIYIFQLEKDNNYQKRPI